MRHETVIEALADLDPEQREALAKVAGEALARVRVTLDWGTGLRSREPREDARKLAAVARHANLLREAVEGLGAAPGAVLRRDLVLSLRVRGTREAEALARNPESALAALAVEALRASEGYAARGRKRGRKPEVAARIVVAAVLAEAWRDHVAEPERGSGPNATAFERYAVAALREAADGAGEPLASELRVGLRVVRAALG